MKGNNKKKHKKNIDSRCDMDSQFTSCPLYHSRYILTMSAKSATTLPIDIPNWYRDQQTDIEINAVTDAFERNA